MSADVGGVTNARFADWVLARDHDDGLSHGFDCGAYFPPKPPQSEAPVKIAVVIPTRNEAPTIAGVTAAADAGLSALGGGALIVNADGGSDDGTGEVFLATPTGTSKRLLAVEGEPGKGRNLLAAWRLCLH